MYVFKFEHEQGAGSGAERAVERDRAEGRGKYRVSAEKYATVMDF